MAITDEERAVWQSVMKAANVRAEALRRASAARPKDNLQFVSSLVMAERRRKFVANWRQTVMLALRAEGLSYAKVGKVAGLSGGRVAEIERKAERHFQHRVNRAS